MHLSLIGTIKKSLKEEADILQTTNEFISFTQYEVEQKKKNNKFRCISLINLYVLFSYFNVVAMLFEQIYF